MAILLNLVCFLKDGICVAAVKLLLAGMAVFEEEEEEEEEEIFI